MRKMIPIVLALGASLAFSVAAQSQTLKTVQDRGSLICGVNPGLEGFASKDANGKWSGFDVDFCRAVAAAIFDDPSKVQYVPLSASDRFEALKNKQIDVLSRNSSWTMGREGDNGVVFTGVTYYDGQGFLVPKSSNFQSALELDGSKVCVQPGTTTELNFVDFFEANHMKYETVHEASADDMIAAYQDGKCDVLDHGRVWAFRHASTAREADRQHDPARHHLEGAARSCGQAGRHAMVQYRQVGQLRHAQCRGAWRQLEDDR